MSCPTLAQFSPLLIVCAMIHVAPSRAHAADYSADDRRIAYEGRTAPGPDHRVRLGYPGITIHLRANAAAVVMKTNASSDGVYFNVSIDGAAPQRVQAPKGEGTVTLLQMNVAGEHALDVVRRTESWQGTCDILGFTTKEGELLDAPGLPTRKLLFIGDSVTCGEGTEPEASPDPHSPLRADAEASFGMQLARRLHAQCDLVSYGGRGVIRDWQGNRTTATAPQFYELALPDDPTSWWNHASYVPDAVGICLGTNDFSRGIPDENEFVNAYVEFVRKIQRDAPHAVIFLIDSPILNDGAGEPPKRSTLGAFLDEVVSKVASPNVRHAVIKHYNGAPDNAHPTAADHTGITNELEPLFRTALKW